jgi:hypothetical protein
VAAAGLASFMEITGKTGTEVVKGLSGSPMLLALLVLNGVGITAAVWYLEKINSRNAELFARVLNSCLPGGG